MLFMCFNEPFNAVASTLTQCEPQEITETQSKYSFVYNTVMHRLMTDTFWETRRSAISSLCERHTV